MNSGFRFSDYLIFLILFVNLYISTDLPGQFTLKSSIHYIQIALIIIFLFCTIDFSKIRFNPYGINLTGFIIIFICLAFILSTFVFNFGSNSDFKSIAKIITYPLVIYVFFNYLGYKFVNDQNYFENYLLVFLYFGILNSIVSWLILFLNLFPDSTYYFTTHGIFVHPNTASFLFILEIPLALYFYYIKKINLVTVSAVMLLLILTLLFTFSRAGYLGAFSAVFIFMFLVSKSKKVFLVSVFVLLLVVSTFLIDFITAKQDSSYGRLLLLLTAYNMILQSSHSMLWGYGVYSGVEIFREEKLFFGNYEFVDDPHNFLLLMGIQFGAVIPFLVLLFIMLVYAKVFFLNKKNYSGDEMISIYLSVSVTSGYLINNMLEDAIAYTEYFVMPVFLMFLGYLYYSGKKFSL